MASAHLADNAIPLETVVVTSDLQNRPARPRDDRAYADALTTLTSALANSPRTILEKLCEVAQKVCHSGSAGVSLLSRKDAGSKFYWPAITGAWKEHVGGGTPRDFGPCGIVLDRNCTQLFAHPERYYPYIRGVTPEIQEVMLAPFYVKGVAVGTVWVLSHDPERRFDGEDQRQLEGLASFASAAYQVLDSLDALEDRGREVAQTMERLQATLSANEVATWIWDVKTDRVYADENLARLFNLTPAQAAGGPLGDYLVAMHPDDVPGVQAAIGETLSGRQDHYEVEYRVTGHDGLTRWISARGKPIRDADGSIARFPGVIIDITARKLAEQALRDADRRKDEFLAMLAHELRNPLAPIRNGVRILDQTSSPTAVAQVLPMMQRQVDHMVRLVDDLLDVSRVSRGKIELRRERVDLAAMLRQVMEAARPGCERVQHSLSLTLPAQAIHLDADGTRLTQVFNNVLNNACKFTNRGGRISITAELRGDVAIVRVHDTGIGISAEQLPQIFELFAQADTSLGRSESGLGIGLTLVKRLVEMHGGSVEARSAGLGHGTEVEVRLPALHAEPAVVEVAAKTVIADVLARRILVVDDNRDSAESLAMLLQLDGHQVQVSVDGESALHMLEQSAVDTVLLDIGLPGMNGFEIAQAIRARYTRPIQLIALTGWGQMEIRTRAQAAGFDAHVTKPVDLEKLRQLLQNTPTT